MSLDNNRKDQRKLMKQITIRIEDNQYELLQEISKAYKIKNVSWLIRRAIDHYVTTYRKEDIP